MRIGAFECLQNLNSYFSHSNLTIHVQTRIKVVVLIQTDTGILFLSFFSTTSKSSFLSMVFSEFIKHKLMVFRKARNSFLKIDISNIQRNYTILIFIRCKMSCMQINMLVTYMAIFNNGLCSKYFQAYLKLSVSVKINEWSLKNNKWTSATLNMIPTDYTKAIL